MRNLLVALLSVLGFAGVAFGYSAVLLSGGTTATPAGGQAVLSGCVQNTGGGGTSLIIDATSLSIQDGDLVFYLIGAGATTANDPAMTANGSNAWVTAASYAEDDPVGGTPMSALFYHVAASDTVSDYRVDWAIAAASQGWVCRVTGQGATVQDQISTATGVSDSIDASATVGSSVLVLYMALHDGGSDDLLCPAISGVVEACTVAESTGVDIGIASGVTTGATGTVSFPSVNPDPSIDQWRTFTWSINGT